MDIRKKKQKHVWSGQVLEALWKRSAVAYVGGGSEPEGSPIHDDEFPKFWELRPGGKMEGNFRCTHPARWFPYFNGPACIHISSLNRGWARVCTPQMTSDYDPGLIQLHLQGVKGRKMLVRGGGN